MTIAVLVFVGLLVLAPMVGSPILTWRMQRLVDAYNAETERLERDKREQEAA